MANGPLYFAYVGGEVDPAFSLITTGDIWSGEITVSATTWGGSLTTTADVLVGEFSLSNMLRDDGLIVGSSYVISGPGIATTDGGGSPLSVQFTYEGDFTGAIDVAAIANSLSASLLITSEDGRNVVFLHDVSQLISGREYGIEGNGFPAGTTFTFSGSSQITVSQPCSTTAKSSAVTIKSLTDKNILKNLGSISGLVDGQVYNVFGQGIEAGTIGTYHTGDNFLQISKNAQVSQVGVTVYINKGVTYSDGGDFDPAAHAVEDEKILDIELSQSEGDFAALVIEVPKPIVGILNASRKFWCWLSYDTGGGPIPMFHGRLVGMPEDTGLETIKLRFIARPEDYQSRKIILAETLKVAPFWDEIWLADGQDDPDTVLNARTQLWDIDRNSLALSVTDIINAEDGTIILDESQILYDNFDRNYLSTPLRRVNVTAEVAWQQVAQGTVDITQELYNAFASAGSGMGFPVISSFTGNGLKATWPQPRAAFAGGWSVDPSSSLIDATWQKTGQYAVEYRAPDPAAQTTQQQTGGINGQAILSEPTVPSIGAQTLTKDATYNVLFDLSVFAFNFALRYDTSRDRSETISFSVEADVQPVMVEPGATEQATFDFHSDFITLPIDNEGAVPLIDLRQNTYFKTERGIQSFEYLVMYAVAQLLMRARCVSIKVATDWISILDISCRKNVQLFDRRINGGSAIGKVIEYSFKGNGDSGEFVGNVTAGCTVGNGTTVTPVAGTNVYAADGYMNDGYQKKKGGQVNLITDSLAYQSFDDFNITDDDGLDLFNMTPQKSIIELFVTGGRSEQKAAIDEAAEKASVSGDPVTALSLMPTRVRLKLVPVTGGAFKSFYNVIISPLAVPKTIDLGA